MRASASVSAENRQWQPQPVRFALQGCAALTRPEDFIKSSPTAAAAARELGPRSFDALFELCAPLLDAWQEKVLPAAPRCGPLVSDLYTLGGFTCISAYLAVIYIVVCLVSRKQMPLDGAAGRVAETIILVFAYCDNSMRKKGRRCRKRRMQVTQICHGDLAVVTRARQPSAMHTLCFGLVEPAPLAAGFIGIHCSPPVVLWFLCAPLHITSYFFIRFLSFDLPCFACCSAT